MNSFTRFCRSFLFILFLFVFSACTVTVTTNNPAMPPLTSAADTQVVPATPIITFMPTDPQPAPQVTTEVGSGDPVPFIKPADSDTPAAGICGSDAGEIVQIWLGTGSDGLPVGGRCVQVTPLQRIELVNLTFESFHVTFGMFDVEVPSGGILLLNKPAGEYLAPGVHFLPNGPVVWLKTAEAVPAATVPVPPQTYSNSEIGYSLILPSNWRVDEHGSPAVETIFYPEDAEPFVAYVSILLESRSMDEIDSAYARYVPDGVRSDTFFSGLPAVQYTFPSGRVEYFIPYADRIILVSTDRSSDGDVQAVLGSIRFAPVTP